MIETTRIFQKEKKTKKNQKCGISKKMSWTENSKADTQIQVFPGIEPNIYTS